MSPQIGFEPTQADCIAFQVRRLNHSAITATGMLSSKQQQQQQSQQQKQQVTRLALQFCLFFF